MLARPEHALTSLGKSKTLPAPKNTYFLNTYMEPFVRFNFDNPHGPRRLFVCAI